MNASVNPSIAVLEKRMRPGAFSAVGFLGPDESLQAVIDADDRTLGQLGFSHQVVADALARILQEALDQRSKLLDADYEQYKRREVYFQEIEPPESVLIYADRWEPAWNEVPICHLYPSEAAANLPANLPPSDVGYLVDSECQVFFVTSRGFQECPWGCPIEGEARWADFDFLVLNRTTGRFIKGPGLIVHLIRHHHFFEGQESPYRTDPTQLGRVLGLLQDSEVT